MNDIATTTERFSSLTCVHFMSLSYFHDMCLFYYRFLFKRMFGIQPVSMLSILLVPVVKDEREKYLACRIATDRWLLLLYSLKC